MSEADPARKRVSRPHDARAVRSRIALRRALLELIETRPFESITIKEVTAAAGVSYPVFFRQFADTGQLLADLAREEVRNLLSRTLPAFDSANPSANLGGMCDYVLDHRKLWTALLTAGAVSAMRKEFIRIAREIGETRARVNPGLSLDLAAPFVVSGIFEILSWWLRQPEDYPVENVTNLLDVLILRPISDAIAIDLR